MLEKGKWNGKGGGPSLNGDGGRLASDIATQEGGCSRIRIHEVKKPLDGVGRQEGRREEKKHIKGKWGANERGKGFVGLGGL